MGRSGTTRRGIGVLVASNILGGVGVASGIAVGALLVEQVGGTSVAGLGQAMSVLGAAVAAVPLVAVATRWGRRWSLTLGYALAVLGGALVVVAASSAGWSCCWSAWGCSASPRPRTCRPGTPPRSWPRRDAGADDVGRGLGDHHRLRRRAQPHRRRSAAGVRVGVPALAGPYLFSVVAFALAGMVARASSSARGRVPASAPAQERSASPASRAVERARARRSVPPARCAGRSATRSPASRSSSSPSRTPRWSWSWR